MIASKISRCYLGNVNIQIHLLAIKMICLIFTKPIKPFVGQGFYKAYYIAFCYSDELRNLIGTF